MRSPLITLHLLVIPLQYPFCRRHHHNLAAITSPIVLSDNSKKECSLLLRCSPPEAKQISCTGLIISLAILHLLPIPRSHSNCSSQRYAKTWRHWMTWAMNELGDLRQHYSELQKILCYSSRCEMWLQWTVIGNLIYRDPKLAKKRFKFAHINHLAQLNWKSTANTWYTSGDLYEAK